jgi:hypothetical protein
MLSCLLLALLGNEIYASRQFWFLVVGPLIVFYLFYRWDVRLRQKRSLTSLDLNPIGLVKTKLPASAFPQRADVYVCDKCGRDITKYFQPGRAHVHTPMGPERFLCRCGQKYLTGATEWDHLSEWDRKQRTVPIFLFGSVLSVVFAVPGVLVYLALRRSTAALLSALAITALPFVLLVLAQLPGWLAILASIRRTRFGSSIVSERT